MKGERGFTPIELIIGLAAVLFFGFAAYALFIWMPVALYAEAQCLRAGYPEARVSIGLSTYCTTLDGVVTVRVDKAGEANK